MTLKLYERSSDLLNQIANSIVDRDPSKKDVLYFTIQEINLVEQFLRNLLLEYRKELSQEHSEELEAR